MSRDGLSVLVDAARDILSALSTDNPSIASATTNRWADSGSPLLRRLAIDAVRQAIWMSPDEKLQWLLDRDLIYEPSTKHEVFQVLAAAFPVAGDDARNTTLKRVRQGIRAKDEPRLKKPTREYERYNLLYWLSKVASDDVHVQEVFRKEQERHPDFAPRDDPDLEIGDVQFSIVRSSVTAEELLKKRVGDLRVAKALITFEDEADRGDKERYSFLEVVGTAAAARPDWGLRLAKSLVRMKAWDSDLWRGLAEGWGRSHADEGKWEAIFKLLNSHQRPRVFAHQGARMLTEFVQSQQTAASDVVLAAEDLSEVLWRSVSRSSDDEELLGIDWLTAAINEPGGKLVEFWVRLLSLRIRESGATVLSARDRSRFSAVLAGSGIAAQAGRVLLASQLHLLLAADRDWTRKNLLPLFDWELNEHRAEQAWHGFLVWARLDEFLIEIMLPLYIATFPRLGDRDDEWRRRFTEHLAMIAVRSARNPVEDGWIVQFVTRTSAESRAEWAAHVAFLLRALESDGKKTQWEKWLRRYWSDRLAGLPRELARAEAGEMAAWAASLEPVFEEAVDLLSRSPAGRPEAYVYNFLDDGRLPDEKPKAVLRLLAHVLTAERQPFYPCHEVISILQKVNAHRPPRQELEGVVNQLVGLGCEEVLDVLR